MFQKKSDKLEAFIGSSSELKGDSSVNGTFRIDGKITGNILADWVIIGEDAVIKGDLKARGIIIGGKVTGNIKADEIVEIKHTGQLMGDIFTKKLSVAEGGIFDGRSHVHREDAKLLDFHAEEAIETIEAKETKGK